MDPVRIGVVGAGLIGQRHIASIEQVADAQTVAVVDPHEDGRRFARDRGLELFNSLDELLSKGGVDGVIIATPTPMHMEQAAKCIAADCPILIEKPISTRTEDAESLVLEAERAGVPVLVGHHRRYNPLIRRARDIIEEGALGSVRGFVGTCWFYKPDYYFEQAPWRKKKGAGPVSVNLVHDVDLIRYLVGEIISVQAQASPSARGFENEDIAAAIFQFENGAVGTLTVSDSIAAPWSWEFTAQENPAYPVAPESCYMIGGDRGSLSIPDLRLWSHTGEKPDWWTPISATSQVCQRTDPLIHQISHFARVIRRQEAPLVSGREGLKTLKVIESIQEAALTGETIRL